MMCHDDMASVQGFCRGSASFSAFLQGTTHFTTLFWTGKFLNVDYADKWSGSHWGPTTGRTKMWTWWSQATFSEVWVYYVY
jgi:hypothetical protein